MKLGPYVFTDNIKKSFKALKDTFTRSLVLVYFDPIKKIRVETNTLAFSIIGALY